MKRQWFKIRNRVEWHRLDFWLDGERFPEIPLQIWIAGNRTACTAIDVKWNRNNWRQIRTQPFSPYLPRWEIYSNLHSNKKYTENQAWTRRLGQKRIRKLKSKHRRKTKMDQLETIQEGRRSREELILNWNTQRAKK